MANIDNLTPFTTENQPANRGRKKGSLNRSTVLKKWLSVRTTVKNPVTKKDEKMTVEDTVILALINEARKGNVQAIKEVQDTIYGKIADKQELTGANGGPVETRIILPKLDDN